MNYTKIWIWHHQYCLLYINLKKIKNVQLGNIISYVDNNSNKNNRNNCFIALIHVNLC